MGESSPLLRGGTSLLVEAQVSRVTCPAGGEGWRARGISPIMGGRAGTSLPPLKPLDTNSSHNKSSHVFRLCHFKGCFYIIHYKLLNIFVAYANGHI